VKNISDSIQEFYAKIIDLESHTTQSTPLEEREKLEKKNMNIVDRFRSLDEECINLYDESTKVWIQFLENAELQILE
jgi:hypothetical protein